MWVRFFSAYILASLVKLYQEDSVIWSINPFFICINLLYYPATLIGVRGFFYVLWAVEGLKQY